MMGRVAMAECKLSFVVDGSALAASLSELADLPECFRHRVQGFLDGLDSFTDLVHVRLYRCSAEVAGNHTIIFEPANCLVEFLSACRAGDGNAHVVEA